MTAQIVFMPLLNEGTDVWRPVQSTLVDDETYEILGPQPEGEIWAFPPGSRVFCALRKFDDGDERLVAKSFA